MNVSGKMKNIRILITCFLLLFLAACSSSRKLSSPVKSFQDSLPSLPTSEIDIPIHIFARPILEKIEQTVSKEFTSESWPNFLQPSCDFRYKYRFIRSPFSLTCSNNLIAVQFTGNYQVAGSRCICSLSQPVSPWISGSCGFGKEPMRKVTIRINSQLGFLPSYQIRTATRLAQLQAVDKCQVSLMSSDVTQQILDSVKSSVNTFCSSLDSTMAGLSFSGLFQQVKEKGFQKTNLGKYGYLLINPVGIRVGQLNYARDSFAISVGLSCKPELSSDSVNHIATAVLPPLLASGSRNGISCYVNGGFDYPFLSKILRDTLYNKVFELKGRTIVIKNVELKGIGNRQIEVKIDFAGNNSGSIYLRGTPTLDTAKQTLTIPDLTYTLESQDLAIKIARSLFKNKIRKSIQGKSYLDIGALVKSNLTEISASLNRRLTANITTRGIAREVKVIGLLVREDILQVQVQILADLTCEVQSIL